MASRAIVKTREADASRAADIDKAAEVAQRFPGWAVWSSRDGKQRVATRSGNTEFTDDGVFAATLLADTWDDLELQLAEQVQHDAALELTS